MTVSNAITLSRILLAPVFLFWFLTGDQAGLDPSLSLAIVWALFFIIEATDFFDGFVARLLHEESEIGRVFDPMADSLCRLTYFLAFTFAGLMPLWIFVVVLYRDLWISFVRLLLQRSGTTQGARISGKIKAWVYAFGGIAGLLTYSCKKVLIFSQHYDTVLFVSQIVFFVVVIAALWTFVDYTRILIKKS